MKHSGWKKGNRANRKSQLKFTKILLIILLSAGLLITFPEIASALEIDRMDTLSSLMGSAPISLQ